MSKWLAVLAATACSSAHIQRPWGPADPPLCWYPSVPGGVPDRVGDVPAGYLRSGNRDPGMAFDMGEAGACQDITTVLRGLREPRLHPPPPQQPLHAYRLTYLRSFDTAVTVRLVVNDDGGGTLIAKVGVRRQSRGVIDEGAPPAREVHTRVSRREVAHFIASLDAGPYWRMWPVMWLTGDMVFVPSDGTTWFLEARRGPRYQIVERRSPNHMPWYAGNSELAAAGLWLLERSGLDLDLNDP